ncbi:MAG: hypothetical protein ACYC3I_15225 [Gemmataceae bacterium]
MPIALSCGCGRALRVKDELAGKNIRCPDCKSILTVPAKETEVEEVVLELIPVEDDEQAEEPALEAIPIEDDEEAAGGGPHRTAIQAELPEVLPARPSDIEDDAPPPPRRSRPRRGFRRRPARTTHGSGFFENINTGSLGCGGTLIVVSLLWLCIGLSSGWLYYFPLLLLVAGAGMLLKGLRGE